jgi:threonine/homoserine/homoserine lactone efflux protein
MLQDYEKQKQQQKASMKAIREYGMGLVIFGAGLFFIFRTQFKLDFNERFPPDAIDKWFGAICLIYGAWRIYRGYQTKRQF